ncbi:MAG: DUF4180 domain-containing protein [Clostridiaceae bacterium]
MNVNIIKKNNTEIAVISDREILITDVQSALDLIATVRYETGCDHIILNKDAVAEDFFDLSTKLAGEVLQKFVNYQMKVAFVGDFSIYSSKSLRDFILESNKGNAIFFMPDEKEAVEKLSKL